jgi:DNA-binding XRE family transcriptional regulator
MSIVEAVRVGDVERAREQDFLAELIDDYAAAAPAFPQLYEAAVRQRALLRTLAEKRAAAGISQRELARRMGTSQPAIARLERGEVDPKLSTLQRFAAAIGLEIDWRLRPARPRRVSGARARR